MDTLKLEPGDFMKNAGIVGFQRMMEIFCRKQGRCFDASQTEYSVEELLKLDLTQMCIDAFLEIYGEGTTVGIMLKKLEWWVETLQKPEEKFEVTKFKTDWENIVGKIASASCKSGYESISSQISGGEIYEELTKKKIKAPDAKSDLTVVLPELLVKLRQLSDFCKQPLVRETFLFKAVIYSVINRFWGNKCFLLRANAKKNMVELFRSEFEKPFKDFLKKDSLKGADYCVECGTVISGKEKVSIAFLKDVADDLSRKSSAFWNCRPDAYICPTCAFLYALAPLGFVQVENGDFMFVNSNSSVASLCANNTSKTKEGTVPSWNQRLNLAIAQLLEGKEKISESVQVITRLAQENKYRFNVIDRGRVKVLRDAKKSLEFLSRQSAIKYSSGDYTSVYQECILNILNYRNQYNLLNRLILESMKQGWLKVFLSAVLDVQSQQIISQKEKKPMELEKQQHFAAKSGAELREVLVRLKMGENAAALSEEKKEDLLRGTVYQLTNALKVQNTEQFMDLIIRIYSSCKKPVPTVFLAALRDTDAFALIGYAFVIGLKGGFYDKNNKNQTSDSLPKGE